MQPAQAEGDGGPSTLRKWGPIGAIALVIAAVVGLVVVSGGDDGGDDAAPATTENAAESTEPDTTEPDGTEPDGTEPTDTEPDSTEPDSTEADGTEPDDGGGGEITFPLSFSDAQEQGIEVDWGDRCDTERGTVAINWYFAPQCFAPFEGDNGGATSRGVTEDTIKVVRYQGPDDDPVINYLTDAINVDDTNAEEIETLEGFIDMFEQFYELYGRTVELEVYESTGIASDEVTARADAVRIAEDFEPFVVIGGPSLTNAFADELAAREVMCISCTPGQPPDWYAERDPYVWSLATGSRQSRAHAREWIAEQLLGENAEYAGDEAFQGRPRTFGHVFLESSAESTAIADEFVAGLREDGAEVVDVLPYVLDPGTIQSQASQIIAKLKASGVTSVIFVGDGIAPRDLTNEATAQEYFPEWIIAAPTLVDVTAFARTYDQQQWASAFGVTHLAARTEPSISGYSAVYEWYTGQDAPAFDTVDVFMPGPSLFFSVLQNAGPELTPRTWRDALFDADSTVAAISQPVLSWGDKGIWPDVPDYNGVDDATLIWWDPQATGPDEIRKDGTGMYQYVDGGRRYLPGEWTEESRFFDPDGAVALYETPPPGEEPPGYPSPAS